MRSRSRWRPAARSSRRRNSTARQYARADGGGPAADRGRSPSARGSPGGGDRPAGRAERAAARHRVRAGVAVHRRPGAADAADAPPAARGRARRSDVPRPRAPAAGGHPAPISARRSRRRTTASASCASTTRRSSPGPSTTVSCCASSRRRSRASSNAARSPRSWRTAPRASTLGFAAANIGSFDWDLGTNALHFDDRLLELFGYTAETFTPHIDSFTRPPAPRGPRAHARRRSRRRSTRAATTRPTTGWSTTTGRSAGSRRAAGCCATRRARPARMLGAAYDTTAVHNAVRAPRPRARDDEHRVHHPGPQLEVHLRQRRGGADARPAARRAPERRPVDDAPGAQGHARPGPSYRQALRGGDEVGFEHYHPPLDAWFDVRAIPSEDGLSVYFHDITGRVRAEQDAARLAGERADALAASGAATGRLQILSGAERPARRHARGRRAAADPLRRDRQRVRDGRRGRAQGADHPRPGGQGDDADRRRGFRVAHVAGVDDGAARPPDPGRRARRRRGAGPRRRTSSTSASAPAPPSRSRSSPAGACSARSSCSTRSRARSTGAC